jgi:hypothetical protein
MSLHEAEYHHSHAERNRTLDGQQVLTIKQFADLNGFSVFTARRLIKAGKGPVDTIFRLPRNPTRHQIWLISVTSTHLAAHRRRLSIAAQSSAELGELSSVAAWR